MFELTVRDHRWLPSAKPDLALEPYPASRRTCTAFPHLLKWPLYSYNERNLSKHSSDIITCLKSTLAHLL